MHRKIKNSTAYLSIGLMLVIALGASFLLVRENKVPSKAANSYTATFALTPSGTVAKAPSDTFTVSPTVSLTTGSAYAVQADLRYNSSVLEVVSYTKPTTKCTQEGPTINTPGQFTLVLGCYAPNPLTSADGTFSLATITFRAKAAGSTSIALQPYNSANTFVGSWADMGGEAFNTNTVSGTAGSLTVNVNDPLGSLTFSTAGYRSVLMPVAGNRVSFVLVAKNTAGATQAGKTVSWTSSLLAGDTLTPATATTDANGQAKFYLTSTSTSYNRALNVTFNSEGLTQVAAITVKKPGDLAAPVNVVDLSDFGALGKAWSAGPVAETVVENIYNYVVATGVADTAVNANDLSVLMAWWNK